MNKQELLENYTAEQLAEMVIELKNIPTSGKISCENSGNGDLIKAKCDKCGEEFLAFLDEKYILCKKTEFFGTQDANKQLNKDVEKLQSEVEKYRKAFEDAKNERDCQIAELKEYTDSLKCSVDRKQDAINQIDSIICELFGVAHYGDIYSEDFKELLKEKSAVGKTVYDFMPTEPIKVADMLINATYTREKGDIEKAFYKAFGNNSVMVEENMFDISELRQIAEHLFVYCNHNGEV